jgi:hypothetical protein
MCWYRSRVPTLAKNARMGHPLCRADAKQDQRVGHPPPHTRDAQCRFARFSRNVVQFENYLGRCSDGDSETAKNPPAGFREGFHLVRLVMRELRWPLESPWGP